MRSPLAALVGILGVALLSGSMSCASAARKKQEAVYGPSESILELVSVLRRHVPDDTYRFPPAVDFSGRNVYRASLLRLENLERVHAESLLAGHMDGVIAFAKGRALERLRAFDLAAQHYRAAALHEGVLRDEALRSAQICESLDAATFGIDLIDPLSEDSERRHLPSDPEEVLADLDERVAQLSALLDRVVEGDDGHYASVSREEIERADVTRARYFAALRHVLPDGHVRAVAELQRVAARHRSSKDWRRHLLALANLYSELAQEYVEANPPEGLRCDPPRFQELVDGAARLYQAVANQDGTSEKLDAARRLEAFLAFTLQVDRDRFTR